MVGPVELDHVTAIVANADEAATVLARLLGTDPVHRVQTSAMNIHTFALGAIELHVNSPTGPGPVADQLAERGPALHHLAIRVDDLDARIAQLERAGFAVRGPTITTAPGVREVFLDPQTTAGLWIQLVERSADEGADQTFDPRAIDRLATSAER